VGFLEKISFEPEMKTEEVVDGDNGEKANELILIVVMKRNRMDMVSQWLNGCTVNIDSMDGRMEQTS